MKISKCRASNFGSYEELEFDFLDQGLTLIQGATGSGKSTICDIAAWALFGITAKNGAVDDIRSWNNPNEAAEVELTVDTPKGQITVFRTRGRPNQNDLYWIEASNEGMNRGKDISETQKLLEKRLGVSQDLYLASSYLSEFSTTGNFFLAKSKERRQLFEQIAMLEFPLRLAEKSSEKRKEVKKALEKAMLEISTTKGRLQQLESVSKDVLFQSKDWESEHRMQVGELVIKFNNFETEKSSKIEALKTQEKSWAENNERKIADLLHKIEDAEKIKPCSKCGRGPKSNKDLLLSQLELLNTDRNPVSRQVKEAESMKNTYDEQLKAKESEANPFKSQLEKLGNNIVITEKELSNNIKQMQEYQNTIEKLTRIYDLSFDLQGLLLQKAVSEIQTATNEYLTKYFDSELKVEFTLSSSDLEIIIEKNGYPCNYKQLSRGQRCMLKLCFSVSVMEVAANNHGIHFDSLFMDEPTDGLDTQLKIKAFSLFEELSLKHKSVFIIEHSEELKSMFENKHLVTIEADNSTIRKV